jgi:hypothetical protein
LLREENFGSAGRSRAYNTEAEDANRAARGTGPERGTPFDKLRDRRKWLRDRRRWLRDRRRWFRGRLRPGTTGVLPIDTTGADMEQSMRPPAERTM